MSGIPLSRSLRSAREAAGISRERAAVAIDRSWGTIRSYERGDVVPPIDRLVILARLYRVTLDELINTEAVTIDAA